MGNPYTEILCWAGCVASCPSTRNTWLLKHYYLSGNLSLCSQLCFDLWVSVLKSQSSQSGKLSPWYLWPLPSHHLSEQKFSRPKASKQIIHNIQISQTAWAAGDYHLWQKPYASYAANPEVKWGCRILSQVEATGGQKIQTKVAQDSRNPSVPSDLPAKYFKAVHKYLLVQKCSFLQKTAESADSFKKDTQALFFFFSRRISNICWHPQAERQIFFQFKKHMLLSLSKKKTNENTLHPKQLRRAVG